MLRNAPQQDRGFEELVFSVKNIVIIIIIINAKRHENNIRKGQRPLRRR